MSFARRTLGHLQLSRPGYAVGFGLAMSLTVAYGHDGSGQIVADALNMITAGVALTLLLGGVYVLNDLIDLQSDRTNHPHRPLPTGRATAGAALGQALVLIAGAIALALAVSGRFAVGMVLLGTGLVAYDLCSKQIGPAKPLVVATLTVMLYPLAMVGAGQHPVDLPYALGCFAGWFWLTAFGYEVLTDLRDVAGDTTLGHRSYAARRPGVWSIIARSAIAGSVVPLVLVALGQVGWAYWLVMPAAVVVALWGVVQPVDRCLMTIRIATVLVGVAALAGLVSR